jgi:hypothetical protein
MLQHIRLLSLLWLCFVQVNKLCKENYQKTEFDVKDKELHVIVRTRYSLENMPQSWTSENCT